MKPIITDEYAIEALVENSAVTQDDYPTMAEYLFAKYGSYENAFEAWKIQAAEHLPDDNPPFSFFMLLIEAADATKH